MTRSPTPNGWPGSGSLSACNAQAGCCGCGGLMMATHEEQLERIDGRLGELYPAAFLQVVATAQAQGQSPPDFLSWYTRLGRI